MVRPSFTAVHAVILVVACIISYNIGVWSAEVTTIVVPDTAAVAATPPQCLCHCEPCQPCHGLNAPASETLQASAPSSSVAVNAGPPAAAASNSVPEPTPSPALAAPATVPGASDVPPASTPQVPPGVVALAFSVAPATPDFRTVSMNHRGPKKPTDKVTDHHYMVAYDNFLDVFRGQPINFLEIGLGCNVGHPTAQHSFDNVGASAPIWPNYFAKGSNVSFVEYDKACLEIHFGTSWDSAGSVTPVISGHPIRIFHGDQSKVEDMERALAGVGPLDVLVDDGSHRWRDQRLTTVFALTKGVKPGGLFVMEDLLTSYDDYWRAHPGPQYNIGGVKPMTKMIHAMFAASISGDKSSSDDDADRVLEELSWSVCVTNEVCLFRRKASAIISMPAQPPSAVAPVILDIAGPRSTPATFLASFMAPFQGTSSSPAVRILNAAPVSCQHAESGAIASAWSGLFNQPVDLTVAVQAGCTLPPAMTNGEDNVRYVIPDSDMSRLPRNLGGGYDIILDGQPSTARVEAIFNWSRGAPRPGMMRNHGIYLASSMKDFQRVQRWLDMLMHPSGGYRAAAVAVEFFACAYVPGSPAPCAVRFQPR